jgi:hypothetical protein
MSQIMFPPAPDADPTNRYPQAVEWIYALLRVAAGLMLVPHVWPKLMAGPTAIAANVMAREDWNRHFSSHTRRLSLNWPASF